MRIYIVLLFVVILSVLADYALKNASLKTAPFLSAWFSSGVLLYGITAFGWITLMRAYDLAQIAVIYSAATIIALTLIGILSFGETLSKKQLVGLAAALLSVVLTEADA